MKEEGPMRRPELIKSRLRSIWQGNRAQISQGRRRHAHESGFAQLCLLLEKPQHVLSYASFMDEFDTRAVNDWLAAKGKLLLPMICGDRLHLYHVAHPSKELVCNRYGILEPDPSRCSPAAPGSVTCALVPGLAFDRFRFRLGYGKGYYDRLLPQLPANAETYGLGFAEQLLPTALPVESFDVPLQQLLLF